VEGTADSPTAPIALRAMAPVGITRVRRSGREWCGVTRAERDRIPRPNTEDVGHPVGAVKRAYSPERMIGAVGVLEPPAFSMVMPKALAGTPLGILGSTTEA
jgi:hypothetical protein